MRWEIQPEPASDAERDALLAAAEAVALDGEVDSAWWRSGLDDLGGPPPEQLGGDSRVVEP